MLGAILQLMIPAIALAIERDGTKRNQQVIEEQHDIGPLMPDDKAMPVMERWGVFRMQTGATLARTSRHAICLHSFDHRSLAPRTLQGIRVLGYAPATRL